MRTRSLSTLAVVGLLAATTATASAGATPHATPNLARQHAMARAATALLRAGVPGQRLAAAGLLASDDDSSSSLTVVYGPGGGSYLGAVENLDGRGPKDVLEVRYVSGPHPKHLGLYARDGGTGALLWQHTYAIAKNHFMFPLPMRTGPAGQAGILVCDYSFTDQRGSNGSMASTVTIRQTALDGRGRQLWTRSDSGTDRFDNDVTYTHVPSLAGIMSGTSRRPDSVLLLVGDGVQTFGDATTQGHGTVQPYALDGRTGKAVKIGAAASSSDAFPGVQWVPDFSGDGRDDIALLSPGSQPRLELRRGTDAKPIWTTTTAAMRAGAYVQSAGRVTGAKAGVPDLALVAPPSSDDITQSFPLDALPTPAAHGTVSLLSGTDGTTVWSKSGDGAYSVERAGPGLTPALGVTSTETTSDSDQTTTTITITTYDVAGTSIYTTNRSTSTTTSSEEGAPSFGVAAVFEAGHVNGTTAVDGLAIMIVLSGRNYDSRVVLFNGQTGEDLPDAQGTRLYGSTTGHGDDMVRTTVKGAVTVDVHRGSDDARRWVRAIPSTSGFSGAIAHAGLLQPGRCADVLVDAAGGDGRRLGAVLASNGQLRWLITHADNDLRPGTVTRAASVPHPRCS